MGPGFIFLLFAAGAAVVIVLAVYHQRRANEAWGEAARRLDLHFSPGSLLSTRRMSGPLDGNAVVVDTYRTGGKNSRTYTRYRVRYPRPLGLGLHLTRQGFFSGITRLLGAQDIEVGEAGFDGDVVVKGADPRRVVAFLTPARRLRAHRLLGALGGCTIGDAEISWSSRGLELSNERIVSVVRRMSTVAVHLSDELPDDRQIDRALEVQREGRLDEALELVRGVAAEGDEEVLDAQVLEAEILYTGGRYGQAAEAFERARRQAPDDAEVAAWAQQSARQAAPAAPEALDQPAAGAAAEPTEPAVPTVTPRDHSPIDAGLDVKAVCESLFAPEKMSFEISRDFERHYQGRGVQWSGTLRTVDDYSYDLVFGSEPGARAVFEICELSGGPYGGRMVQAVVRLPAAQAESLRSRLGQTVTFRGTLASCDAFMRNLYVADGRIEPLPAS